jgi:hypothetical protein
METHNRHFVSQHFGKATVCVQEGVVSIHRDGDGDLAARFSYDPERLALFAADAGKPENVMRSAIAQAHKVVVQHGAHSLFGATFPLVIGCTPWLGDLSEHAYGGATAGYEAPAWTCMLRS